MALKFLNKKGWHTGSLRNIENVWKAEQKHDAEQKKLEELRKQIQEERERSEFRLLQEQAGLVPRQERLEFLYDSGLAVGKSSTSSNFQAFESLPKPGSEISTSASASASASKPESTAPGALFEEKPHSANDAWRKLHSDPLLSIRQKEQEALARIKNNPVQMAMIRKSVEAKNSKGKSSGGKEHGKKHHRKKSKHMKHSSSKHSDSDSENESLKEERRTASDRKRFRYYERSRRTASDSDEETNEGNHYRKSSDKDLKYRKERASDYRSKRGYENNPDEDRRRDDTRPHQSSHGVQHGGDSYHKRRKPFKLSEEERAARLRQMEMDAVIHEEQRFKRLRKAEQKDVEEELRGHSGGRNFLDAAHRSVYGTEKGGSSTIEESVRRRTHYLQGRSEASEGNAFRR